jgi:drug/metabolite transporter (DMT)-like permease
MPTVAMLLVQIGFAGNNLLSKMALDNGASPYVLISCRSLIAALFLAPFAVYFERYARACLCLLVRPLVSFEICCCSRNSVAEQLSFH